MVRNRYVRIKRGKERDKRIRFTFQGVHSEASRTRVGIRRIGHVTRSTSVEQHLSICTLHLGHEWLGDTVVSNKQKKWMREVKRKDI